MNRKSAKGVWKDGLPEGKFKLVYQDDTIYEGMLTQGNRIGHAKLIKYQKPPPKAPPKKQLELPAGFEKKDATYFEVMNPMGVWQQRAYERFRKLKAKEAERKAKQNTIEEDLRRNGQKVFVNALEMKEKNRRSKKYNDKMVREEKEYDRFLDDVDNGVVRGNMFYQYIA